MARPLKDGLDYFPLDSNFFGNDKVKMIKVRFGADGITIFLYLLCSIYKNGYYIKADEDYIYTMSFDLGMSTEKVMQVLTFLLKRSLFDDTLFKSDTILTSTGIQKRFQIAMAERARKRRKPIEVNGGFWLLKESETEPFIKVTHFYDYDRKKVSYSRKNDRFSAEESLKKSKVNNNYIYYSNPALEEEFLRYIDMRNHTGPTLLEEQIFSLKEQLDSMSDDDNERIAICKKAFRSGWKSFYPIKKNNTGKKNTARKNAFHNFEQRSYDYDDLERRLEDRNQKK